MTKRKNPYDLSIKRNTPDKWTHFPVTDAGADVWYHVAAHLPEDYRGEELEEIIDKLLPTEGNDVIAFHWHTPTEGDPEWRSIVLLGATVTNGSYTSEEAGVHNLSVGNLLTCEDGCPLSGHLTDGKWVQS